MIRTFYSRKVTIIDQTRHSSWNDLPGKGEDEANTGSFTQTFACLCRAVVCWRFVFTLERRLLLWVVRLPRH